MKNRHLMSLVTALAGALFVAIPQVASAHEHDTFKVGDKTYGIVIGSFGEPLLVDNMSGVDLTVTQGGKGVEGLEKNLKVEISAGDKKKVLDLQPSDENPGAYSAPFIPTVQTTLAYRLFGTLNGVPVSLSFTCAPDGSFDETAEDKAVKTIADKVTLQDKIGGFSCPEARTDYGFPEPALASAELDQKIMNAAAQPAAPETSDDNAKTLAVTGLLVGALGCLLGIAAMAKRGKG